MTKPATWGSSGFQWVAAQLNTIGPATLQLAGLIVVIYAGEVLVAILEPSQLRYWFGMTNVAPTTPGWFLSIFAHEVVDGPRHYIVNLVALIVVGTIVERHVPRRAYFGLFLVGGYLAGVVQVWINLNVNGETATSVIGASGSILALLGAMGIHFWCHHRGQVSTEDAGIVPIHLLVVLLVPVLVLYFVGQLGGVIPQFVADTGTVSHLVGLLSGIAYGSFQTGCDAR